MRVTINIPDSEAKLILEAAAKLQLETLTNVTLTSFIRRATIAYIKGTNALNTQNHTSDNALNTHNHISDNVTNLTDDNGLSSKFKMTDAIYQEFIKLNKSGATAKTIAAALGCSTPTVSRLRKELKNKAQEK